MKLKPRADGYTITNALLDNQEYAECRSIRTNVSSMKSLRQLVVIVCLNMKLFYNVQLVIRFHGTNCIRL